MKILGYASGFLFAAIMAFAAGWGFADMFVHFVMQS